MESGQVLIATWERICIAVDCDNKRTAKKKLKSLDVTVKMINGIAHISKSELEHKFNTPV